MNINRVTIPTQHIAHLRAEYHANAETRSLGQHSARGQIANRARIKRRDGPIAPLRRTMDRRLVNRHASGVPIE